MGGTGRPGLTRVTGFPGGTVPMQETQEMRVLSLGREGPREEEMATRSRILAWRIPRTEEPGGLRSVGRRVGHDWAIACTR